MMRFVNTAGPERVSYGAPMEVTMIMLALVLLQTEAPKYSGPQAGEALPAFTVLNEGGERVDALAGFDGAPTLLVFVHTVSRPGAKLVRLLDRAAQDRAEYGLRATIVMLTDDEFAQEKYAPTYRKSLGLKTPLTISVDGAEGPGPYGLNKEMELTVLVAKDNKVTHNFALIDPNDTRAGEIEAALDALLPPPAMGAEETARELRRLQMEVKRLQRELDELRQRDNPRRMDRDP